MRNFRIAAVAGLLAVAAVSSAALATGPGIISVGIHAQTPQTVTLQINVAPGHVGAPCLLTFTPIGGSTVTVGMTSVSTGSNTATVSQPGVPGEFDARIHGYDPGWE